MSVHTALFIDTLCIAWATWIAPGRVYSLEIISQLKREERRVKKKKKTKLPIIKITGELCNLPTLGICVELAFGALLKGPHPATQEITPFLSSHKIIGTRNASVNLARFSIHVSIRSGKSQDGIRYVSVLPVH